MGARRSGSDSNKWGRWRSAVVVRGANGGPRRWRWARSPGQHAVGDHPGAGWREFAGDLRLSGGGSSPTAPSGWEWNGLQPGQGAAELGFPRPAPGEMQSEAARRAGEPSGQGEEPPPEVVVMTIGINPEVGRNPGGAVRGPGTRVPRQGGPGSSGTRGCPPWKSPRSGGHPGQRLSVPVRDRRQRILTPAWRRRPCPSWRLHGLGGDIRRFPVQGSPGRLKPQSARREGPMIKPSPVRRHMTRRHDPVRSAMGSPPTMKTYRPQTSMPCAMPALRLPSARSASRTPTSTTTASGRTATKTAEGRSPTSTPSRCSTPSTGYATAPTAGKTRATGPAGHGRRRGSPCGSCTGKPGASPRTSPISTG